MPRVKRILLIGTEGRYGHAVMKGIHADWDFHLGADSSPETVRKARAALRQWKADGILMYIRGEIGENCARCLSLPSWQLRRRHLPPRPVTAGVSPPASACAGGRDPGALRRHQGGTPSRPLPTVPVDLKSSEN